MNRGAILISMVLVLVAVAVLLFYIRHGEVPQGAEGLPSVGENVFEQSVVTPDITFSYPKEFGLAVKEEQVLVSSYIPPCSEGFDYCLYYKGGAYEGTNFDSAGLRIKRRFDLSYETCLSAPPEGFEKVKPITRTSDGYAMSLFPAVGDAGAGHAAEGKLYRLSLSEVCYEFETRIGVSQFENYEPGTVSEFTRSERALLEGELQEILKAVTLTVTGERIQLPE